MIGHEIVGVLVASIVAVAFVSVVVNPNSQMGTLLSNSLGGWSSVLGTIGSGGNVQKAA